MVQVKYLLFKKWVGPWATFWATFSQTHLVILIPILAFVFFRCVNKQNKMSESKIMATAPPTQLSQLQILKTRIRTQFQVPTSLINLSAKFLIRFMGNISEDLFNNDGHNLLRFNGTKNPLKFKSTKLFVAPISFCTFVNYGGN
jgi:hypothetical protein